ncbi:hypothetical protein CPter91_4422 [Collimonas pratensis]|uniref:Uncharacterized protein n=1 Tax=Collimonas pratensis TaxID=279113 RepID=A0A127Q9Q7_9BURK|nr:hypothetical protein CPter91_4422 [Collimonas pratensis]
MRPATKPHEYNITQSPETIMKPAALRMLPLFPHLQEG